MAPPSGGVFFCGVRRMKQLPSIEELEELFDINPETGSIKWKKPGRARKLGQEAGVIRRAAGRLSYRYISVGMEPNRHLIPAHWVIWAHVHRRWPDGQLDHKNRDSLDNRIANLRPATDSEQIYNQKRENRTGFKWIKRIVDEKGQVKFRGTVVANGKKFYTSRYGTAAEAHAAARDLAQRHHGEFFYPGQSPDPKDPDDP